jgi:hypothetical protein
MAGQYHLVCEKYATFSVPLQWLHSDGITPVNLTGWTADLEVKDYSHTSVIVTLSTTDGSILIDGPAGQIQPVLDLDGDGELAGRLSGPCCPSVP